MFVLIYFVYFSLIDPGVTKFTRVIQGESKVITEVQPSVKKVTRVIEGGQPLKKVTRVVTGKYMFIDGTMATHV